MKNFNYSLFQTLVVLCCIVLQSCFKDVVLDEAAEPQLVLEGWIKEGETARIKINYSISRTSQEPFPTEDNASITLANSMGEFETLQLISPGIYEGNEIFGVPAVTYALKVIIGEEEYLAESTMPENSVISEFGEHFYSYGIDSLKFSNLNYNAVLGANTSLFALIDIRLNENLILSNDFLNFENPPDNEIFQEWQFSDFILGDKVTFEIIKPEYFIYDYLEKIEAHNAQAIGGLIIAPPENIIGNISNGALGYFSAMNLKKLEVIVE